MALFKRRVKTVTIDKPAESVQTCPSIARNKSAPDSEPDAPGADAAALEVGGRQGPEPTRYGDWENKGRCVDF